MLDGFSPLSGPPAYRTRLAPSGNAPNNAALSNASAENAGGMPGVHPPTWGDGHIVTWEEMRNRVKADFAAGGEELHETFTDPTTGNTVDQWLLKTKDPEGRTYTTLHRLGGLPAKTERNKNGIVVTEQYVEYGVASRGPEGRVFTFRNPETGAIEDERRQPVTGGVMVTKADNGASHFQAATSGPRQTPPQTPNFIKPNH